MFPGMTVEERIRMLNKADPLLLGFASGIPMYYHQGELWIEGKIKMIEWNNVMLANRIALAYEHNPFSPNAMKELERMKSFKDPDTHKYKEDAESMMQLVNYKQATEFMLMEESASRIKQGFSLGNKKNLSLQEILDIF